MLAIGTILKSVDDEKALFPGYARLLYVSYDDGAWMIRIDVSKSENLKAPFRIFKNDLIEGIRSGQILTNLEYDLGMPLSENQLSNSSRKKMEHNYALMKPLLDEETLISDSERRGRKFAELAIDAKASARNIRRLFLRYLAGGMVKMALAPEFRKCGNPGVAQTTGSGRRGPKAVNSIQCEVPLPEFRDKLEDGARKFYITGNYTLTESYVLTLSKHFLQGMKLTEDIALRDKLEEIISPPTIRPTYMQFRYVCQELERKEGKRGKKPRRARQQDDPWQFRGNARNGINGPGARFEIDATKLQVQLVARYGSAGLVGTPTLFVLIDVWSGAYVGYALSHENSGWALAAKALHCAFQEKEIVFRKLGLPYSNEDWPCAELPTRLTADRAEFISNKSDPVPEIGIKVEIMPPMCPELKGSVESAIKEVKHGRSKKLPGSYPKMPIRREPDGKADAALTLDQLETIIVRQIIKLNNAPVQLQNIPHQMLQAGETNITRIGLYKWGLLNRAGYTRALAAKDVYSNLLSKDFASVTPKGIFYKDHIYFSDVLTDKGYLSRAAISHFRIEIRFDEHIADQILFLDEDSNDWVFAIIDDDDIRRLKVAFFELENFNNEAKQLITTAKLENAYQGLVNDKLDAPMIKEAKRKAKAANIGISKTESKSKIIENKQGERDVIRLLDGKHAVESYTSAISAARAENYEEYDEPIQQKKSITALSGKLWGKKK